MRPLFLIALCLSAGCATDPQFPSIPLAPYTTAHARAPSAAPEPPPAPALQSPPLAGHPTGGSGPLTLPGSIALRGYAQMSYAQALTGRKAQTPQPYDEGTFRPDRISLSLEREFGSGEGFDLGGRLEVLYGTEAMPPRGFLPDQEGDAQFDIPQAYLTVRLPGTHGASISAGRFLWPVFRETAFPSVTFATSPQTMTGGYLAVPVLRDSDGHGVLTLKAGPMLGTDLIKDNNGAFSLYGGVDWEPAHGSKIEANILVGPEHEGDTEDLRALLDITATWDASERLRLAGALSLVMEEEHGHTAFAGSVLAHAAYGVGRTGREREWQLVGQVEFFRDPHGIHLAVPGDLLEVIAGVAWTPEWVYEGHQFVAPVTVRPEIRWSYYTGTDKVPHDHQITALLAVILQF